MARTPNVPPWTVSLEYEPFGLYSRQINVTVTVNEWLHYLKAADGRDFVEWANVALIRRARTWTRKGGRRPHLKGERFYLRLTTVGMAITLYQRTAEQFGYAHTSYWVRAALNKEAGLYD